MKRTIIIELILLFVLAALLALNILYWSRIKALIDCLDPLFDEATAKYIYDDIYRELPYGILALLASVATLAVIILIALKDFKPLADKLSALKTARKQAKAERAEADKQARIEQLQAELEELKKDE